MRYRTPGRSRRRECSTTHAPNRGLDVVIHTVYIEDPYNNYAVKQACRLIETFYRVLDTNADKMELTLNSADMRRIGAKGKIATVLALEGGFDTEGDLDVLRLFHRLGVRMIHTHQPQHHQRLRGREAGCH